MKAFLNLLLGLILAISIPPVMGQEDADGSSEIVENTPLRVTIWPMPKFRFGDFFSYGQTDPVPQLEKLFLCPPDAMFECEAFLDLPTGQGDQFTLRLNRQVSNFVNEKHKNDYGRPDLGLIMGKRYYGQPRYLIMAYYGIDPKLHEPLWKMNGTAQGVYGDLEQENMFSMGDRIGGPIILARSKSQIDRLIKNKGPFGFTN